MAKQLPSVDSPKATRLQLRKMIIELGWNTQLSYDYSTRRTLKNGQDVHYAALADELRELYEAEFSNQSLADVLTGIAMRNSPIVDDEDVLLELVSECVSGRSEVTVREILEANEGKRGFDAINKSLEIRISKCLKQLGYFKQRRQTRNVRHTLWIKPATSAISATLSKESMAACNSSPVRVLDSAAIVPQSYICEENGADELLNAVNLALQ